MSTHFESRREGSRVSQASPSVVTRPIVADDVYVRSPAFAFPACHKPCQRACLQVKWGFTAFDPHVCAPMFPPSRCSDLQRQCALLAASNEALTRQVVAGMAQQGDQGGRTARLEATLASTQAELTRMSADVEALTQERDAALAAAADNAALQKQVTELRGVNQGLSAEAARLLPEVGHLQEENAGLVQAVEQLRADLAAQRQAGAGLAEANSGLEAEVAQLRARVAELEGLLLASGEVLEATVASKDLAVAGLELRAQEAAKLRSALDDADARAVITNAGLKHAEAEGAALRTDLASARSQVATLEQRVRKRPHPTPPHPTPPHPTHRPPPPRHFPLPEPRARAPSPPPYSQRRHPWVRTAGPSMQTAPFYVLCTADHTHTPLVPQVAALEAAATQQQTQDAALAAAQQRVKELEAEVAALQALNRSTEAGFVVVQGELSGLKTFVSEVVGEVAQSRSAGVPPR